MRRIAVVEEDTQGTSKVNIALPLRCDPAQPQRSAAPITPAAPPMRASGATATRFPISTRRFRSTPITRPPTPTGRSPSARPTATIRRWRISRAPSRPTRIMARPISAAATSSRTGSVPGCPERPDRGDPPDAGIGGGASCARPALPEAGHAPSGDPRFRLRHRPQPLRGSALRGPRPELGGDATIRKGDRGFQRCAQRQQPRCRIHGPGAASPTSAWATRQMATESYQRALAVDNGNQVARQGNSEAVARFRSDR